MFILYVITYVIGALVGIAHGFEAIPAISESVAMTSNGGIITSVAGAGMAGNLALFYLFPRFRPRSRRHSLLRPRRLRLAPRRRPRLALIVEVVASLVPRPRPKERS